MQKLKKCFNIILYFLILILILTAPAAAEYFQGNLADFVKTEKQITVPIFKPTEKIEIRAEEDTVLSAAGSEDLKLEEDKLYFITQSTVTTEDPAAGEARSGWGIQLMASSSEEKAVDFKEKAAAELEAELFISEEDGLYKVLAGNFSERSQAEELQQKLEELGYSGWPRESQTARESGEGSELKLEKQTDSGLDKKVLNIYNAAGEKLREAHVFVVEGQFEAKGNQIQGKFNFGPIGNSVLFSYKTDLEELTAYQLQKNFDSDTPEEALKAQAILYRTSLLYQLEIQGARLENLDNLKFGSLNPVFAEAAEATEYQVLVRNKEFYYNNDFSLKDLRKPKAGIIPLAQADYSYQEIINYYYDRANLADLKLLLDSEEKFNARIERGLEMKEIRQMSWSGPRVITVLDFDLKRDNLNLKPVLAQGVVPGREDLVELIKKHSALAGVNGGYFHYSGRPLGLLYINGELVSEPLYNRSALLISEGNQISFGRVDWEGELIIGSAAEKIKLDGINREVNSDELILFNHYYGPRMPALSDEQYDIVVRDNRVLGVENEAGSRTAIPPDGFVLRFSGSRSDLKNRISELKNKEIRLDYNLSPDLKAENVRHAVGGGPRLLRDGEISINGREEKFQKDIINGRSPRTAAALTEDNHLLLLTIDGRQAEWSVGMTLEDVAQTLKNLGAVDAINLDGGGSARMVIRGFNMSTPSEKRLISNGVIVDQKD
ncbi:MAG: phosphodiester glycosidase family protein [Halanaerobium sp.]